MRVMRFVDFKEPGSPSVLGIAERPIPDLEEGCVLIRVVAAGMNRADLMQRAGNYPAPLDASPILGLEAAGEIAELGPGVTSWSVGDKVCSLTNGGAYAEYVMVPASHCLPVPEGLSMIEAAALPEAAMTVWSNVFDLGRLKSPANPCSSMVEREALAHSPFTVETNDLASAIRAIGEQLAADGTNQNSARRHLVVKIFC